MYRYLIVVVALLSWNAYAAECEYLASPPDAVRVSGKTNIDQAWYGSATTRYAHGVLGDAIEAQTLYATLKGKDGCALEVTLDSSAVFEDVTPRIADVTGDGEDNIITIESNVERGASLAIYGVVDNTLTKIVATPAIGTRYRWLAPIGTADFNNDNILDVAYVETPHLAGVIKVWSFANGKADLLVQRAGFSNHRIGENFITGGIANCDNKPVMILPARNWRETLSASVINGDISSRVVAEDTNPDTIASLLQCTSR